MVACVVALVDDDDDERTTFFARATRAGRGATAPPLQTELPLPRERCIRGRVRVSWSQESGSCQGEKKKRFPR